MTSRLFFGNTHSKHLCRCFLFFEASGLLRPAHLVAEIESLVIVSENSYFNRPPCAIDHDTYKSKLAI